MEMHLTRETVEAIGLGAGTLTTLSFLPQLVTTYRKRSAKDLSWGMLLAFSGGVILWLVYGMALRALPIILANAVTLSLLVAIMTMKLRFSRA